MLESLQHRPARSARQRRRKTGLFPQIRAQYILLRRVLRQRESKFKAFQIFWATRRAILRGESLFEQSDSQIASEGYLPPWKFNFAESSFVALGGSAVVLAISKMFGPGQPNPDGIGKEFPFLIAVKISSVLKWCLPFVPPLTLFICAQIAAKLSFRKNDPRATGHERKRLERAYLYLDGAYGLYCQFFLAISTVVLTSAWGMFRDGTNSKALFVTLCLGFFSSVLGSLWQIVVLFRVIPKRLFRLAGYESNFPWKRYVFGMWLALGTITEVLSLIALIVSFSIGIVWGLITMN